MFDSVLNIHSKFDTLTSRLLEIVLNTSLTFCFISADNFCINKDDGTYENEQTTRADDFYHCKNNVERLLYCPFGIAFGSSSRCN